MDVQAYLIGLREDLEQLASLSQQPVELVENVTDNVAWVRTRIQIGSECQFSLNEVVDTDMSYPVFVDYKYQLLARGAVAFRYDCCPHHPDLGTFPEHKHTGVEVTGSERPSRKQCFREVWELVEAGRCEKQGE